MDRPLKIRIRTSRIAVYYCLFVTGLSFVAIGLAELSWFIRVLLSACAAVTGWLAVRAVQTPSVTELECREGNWFLYAGHGWNPVAYGRKVFVGLGVISLRLRLDTGRQFCLVLWPDSADEDSLRRLRIKLFAMEKA